MNTSQPRQPAGSTEGGQFTATSGAESSAALSLQEATSLNDTMEFDCVYHVRADGTVEHNTKLDAPAVLDGEIDSDEWEPLTGFTSQYGYNGMVMHNSEQLGGAMEQHVRDNPGIYTIVPAMWIPEDDYTGEYEPTIEGWVMLRYKGDSA